MKVHDNIEQQGAEVHHLSERQDRHFAELMAKSSLGSLESLSRQRRISGARAREIVSKAKQHSLSDVELELAPWEGLGELDSHRALPRFEKLRRRTASVLLDLFTGFLGLGAALLAGNLIAVTPVISSPAALIAAAATGILSWVVLRAASTSRAGIVRETGTRRAAVGASAAIVFALAVLDVPNSAEWFLAGLCGVLLTALLSLVVDRLVQPDLPRVIVAGSPEASWELTHRLAGQARVVGLFAPQQTGDDATSQSDHAVPLHRDIAALRRAIAEHDISGVVIATRGLDPETLRYLIWSLEDIRADVAVDTPLMGLQTSRIRPHRAGMLNMLWIDKPHTRGWRIILKRALDVVLTSLLLVLASPAVATIAFLVKLQDGGPILFRQTRVGLDGAHFTLYKFRTMVIDAETRKADLMDRNEGAAIFKLRDDPRITPLGRFLRRHYLDELPQFVNILAGRMSLVGPRPHLVHELAMMPSDASRRSLIRPGLTGLWQVSGGPDLSAGEGLELDLYYVDNWSFGGDFRIILKTVPLVVFGGHGKPWRSGRRRSAKARTAASRRGADVKLVVNDPVANARFRFADLAEKARSADMDLTKAANSTAERGRVETRPSIPVIPPSNREVSASLPTAIYKDPVQNLIDELGRLPGIGPKSARRLTSHILAVDEEDVLRLADTLRLIKNTVRFCEICFNVSEEDQCRVCRDPRRDPALICVVEEPKDVMAVERTRKFRGRYHVLGGAISPLEGIGPNELRIRELCQRLADGVVTEVILSTDPNLEGEATANYLSRLLIPMGVKVSRLGSGLPVGGDPEYADEATLGHAFRVRGYVDTGSDSGLIPRI